MQPCGAFGISGQFRSHPLLRVKTHPAPELAAATACMGYCVGPREGFGIVPALPTPCQQTGTSGQVSCVSGTPCLSPGCSPVKKAGLMCSASLATELYKELPIPPLDLPSVGEQHSPKSNQKRTAIPSLSWEGLDSASLLCVVLPTDICRGKGDEKKTSQKIPKLPLLEMFSTLRNAVEASAMAS